MRRALAFVLAGLIGACVDPPETVVPEESDPNEGLLRDFIDGKFDEAGHPLNAKVVEASSVIAEECAGQTREGVRELSGSCRITLPENATSGGILINARLRVRQHASSGRIIALRAYNPAGEQVGSETLSVSRLRARDQWIDLPIKLDDNKQATTIELELAPMAVVDLYYVEVFPKRLQVVISPGAGVYGDSDRVTFELPKGKQIERLQADGVDILPKLKQLLEQGRARRTDTAFRTLYDVAVGDLLPDRGEGTELRVHSRGDTSRTQLRRAPAPCTWEGDPNGEKVLITGFQPFPADGWHENISNVAVTAMRPSILRNAQVMRMILPVEYDRAATSIKEVIERCQPDSVISFGQGGSSIALEQMAYNLQDTGELAGGAPDNRGVIRAATPISVTAPATRETLLPLDAIKTALEAMGEMPRMSDDPGRYICNNVMFENIGAMALRGRAGFIHLPYDTSFDELARAHWGQVVETAVQATVDAP